MLSLAQTEKLKANWPYAESMQCNAEVRLYNTGWEAFITAQNPEDEDQVYILYSCNHFVSYDIDSLQEILSTFNSDGEFPIFDENFRPTPAAGLFKKLNKGR